MQAERVYIAIVGRGEGGEMYDILEEQYVYGFLMIAEAYFAVSNISNECD